MLDACPPAGMVSPLSQGEIRVLEVDAFSSVQDLIQAAIQSYHGAARLTDVRVTLHAATAHTQFALVYGT
jgi:hypothetical protein